MKKETLTLEQAQQLMSKAIKRIDLIIDSGSDAQVMNASNALSGLVSRYVKLCETLDLEKRIERIERQQERQPLKPVKNL